MLSRALPDRTMNVDWLSSKIAYVHTFYGCQLLPEERWFLVKLSSRFMSPLLCILSQKRASSNP